MTLGWKPKHETIILARYSDFIMSRTARNVTIPPGTSIRIQLDTTGGAIQWYGTVTGNTVSWKIEADVVNTIDDGTPFKIFVSYPGAGGVKDDYLFMHGRCRRVSN